MVNGFWKVKAALLEANLIHCWAFCQQQLEGHTHQVRRGFSSSTNSLLLSNRTSFHSVFGLWMHTFLQRCINCAAFNKHALSLLWYFSMLIFCVLYWNSFVLFFHILRVKKVYKNYLFHNFWVSLLQMLSVSHADSWIKAKILEDF